MDDTSATIETVRGYLFEYISGMLWILVACLAAATPENISTIGRLMTQLQASIPTLPDILVGFVVAIGGIVVPYCISKVVWPFTLILMGVMRSLILRIGKGGLQTQERQLQRAAETVIRDRVPLIGFHRRIALTVLRSLDEKMAEQLERSMHEVWFRGLAMLPIAVLVSLGIYRIASAPGPVAIAIGIVIFAVGAWDANKELDVSYAQLATALVLKGSREQPTDGRTMPGNTLPPGLSSPPG